MNLRFEWKNRPLYNVVARIPGTTRPDEWIIFGNHHDAWVSGADDPISGASVADGNGTRPRRIAQDRLAAVAHHRPRAVGRRRVGIARIDRVGGEARRRVEAEGRRLHQYRRHRQRLAERRRLARTAAVHGRGREGRHGSAHRQAGIRGSAAPRRPRRGRRKPQGRRSRSVAAHRSTRIRIRLHAVPPAPDAVGAEPGLWRRESRRRVSLGLRHHQVVPDLFGWRLQLRPHALAADGHADPSARRCAGAAVPVHRYRRHAAALRRRAREARC